MLRWGDTCEETELETKVRGGHTLGFAMHFLVLFYICGRLYTLHSAWCSYRKFIVMLCLREAFHRSDQQIISCKLYLYSVRDRRTGGVILAPSVLSGLVQPFHVWRLGDVWHNGAHCRIVSWIRPDIQDSRWPLRLDTHRARFQRKYPASLLVRSQVVRHHFQQQRKLHFYVAEIRFWSNRRTTGRYFTEDTSAYTGYNDFLS